MSQDTISSFDHKLERWVSKQGLFFLLLHGSGKGSLMAKLIAILIRLVILALIALIAVWFLLKNKIETDGFKDDVTQQISKGMNASNVEISSISRVNGGVLSSDMLISNLKLGETEKSFFKDWKTTEYEVNADGSKNDVEVHHSASLSGVNVSPLNISDSYFNVWNARNVKINSMDIKLKTGANTDAEAQEAYASIFKKYDSLKLSFINVVDGTIRWGNSAKTAGEIKNADFEILRKEESWEIGITGGTLSYAWLQGVNILQMKVICNASGKIEFNQAYVKVGEGVLAFSGEINVLATPEVEGLYEFSKINISDFIGTEYERYISGKINGKGSYRGTLNSAEGITYETSITLSENESDSPEVADSVLVIKGREFELLDVVQTIDLIRGYSNLRAYEGDITIKHEPLAGETKFNLNEVRAGAGGLILMDGAFQLSESDDIPVSEEEEKERGETFSGEIKMGFLPTVFQENAALFGALKSETTVYRIELDADIEGQVGQLTSKAGEKLYQAVEKVKNNR